MDFSFSDDQQALRALVREILGAAATPERLRVAEASADWFDRELWTDLAKAGVLGVVAPESDGGSGGGFLELCVVLEELGRTPVPVPAVPTLLLGAWPLSVWATPEQRARLLSPLVAGDSVMTAALAEPASSDPAAPATVAHSTGGDIRLEGEKIAVPAAHLAAEIVVPATADDGPRLFLVNARAGGVGLQRETATTGEPCARVVLSGAPAESLGEAGASRWLVEHVTAGLCVMQVGLAEEALRMTAAYVVERRQFGRSLAAFQAVRHRLADAYIDVEAMRWTAWRAAWRLAAGLPASDEVAVAKYWAADGGHRVAAAAQHLHGGIGVDMDYPLHRYTLRTKQIELSLGPATSQVAWLGARMARGEPEAAP